MTAHICEISQNSNNGDISIQDTGMHFGLLLLHSDLKKKSFGEKAPHWLMMKHLIEYKSKEIALKIHQND